MNPGKARLAGQVLLHRAGVDDTLDAIGAFSPRGRALRENVGWIAGGLAGEAVGAAIGGGLAGDVGASAGVVLGGEAGAGAGERRGPLPPRVFLATGRQGLYVFGARRRERVPRQLLMILPAGTAIRVRPRVTVRIVELDDGNGTALAMEGGRGTWTHSKSTIAAIRALDAHVPPPPDSP